MKIVSTRNLLLMSAAFLVGLAGAIFALREPMTTLDEAGLAQARAAWAKVGLHDYDLTYRMHGSVYVVQVRDDIVIGLKADGREARTAEWASYSVDGLFALLELELENMADLNGPFRGGSETVVARVRFNGRSGYVERYLRAGGGLPKGASIELLSFESQAK